MSFCSSHRGDCPRAGRLQKKHPAVARHSDRVAQLEAPTKEQLMELLPQDLKEPEAESPAPEEP